MNDETCARIAKAIAHPTRMAILRILVAERDCICGRIVSVLDQPQAPVSQHLKQMRDAGLVQGSIDGPRVCYCLDHAVWQAFQNHLLQIEGPDHDR